MNAAIPARLSSGPRPTAVQVGSSSAAPAPLEDRYLVEERLSGLREGRRDLSGTRHPAAFLLLVVVACGLRLMDVARPVDGTGPDGRREMQRAAVARNFHREGMNPLTPAIDRADGTPAVAAMEFPLVPWLTGGLYEVVGERPALLRVVSCAFSLAAFLLLTGTARLLLPPGGAAAAAWVFAVSPPVVRSASAATSESAAVCLMLAALACFLRWCRTERRPDLVVSSILTGLAIAVGPAAAGLLPVLAVAAFGRAGFRAFARPDLWMFAIVAVALPAAWYAQAHRLWLVEGIVLGMDEPFRMPIGSSDPQAWSAFLKSDDFVHALRAGGGAWEKRLSDLAAPTGLVLGGIGFVVLCLRPRRPSLVLWTVSAAAMLFVATAVPATEFVPGALVLLGVPGALAIGAAFPLAGRWTSSRTAWRILAVAGIAVGVALLVADRFPEQLAEAGWEERLGRFADERGFPAPERVAAAVRRWGLPTRLAPLGVLLAATGLVMGVSGAARFASASGPVVAGGSPVAKSERRLLRGLRDWSLAGVSAAIVLLLTATLLESGRRVLKDRPVQRPGPIAAVAQFLADRPADEAGGRDGGTVP